MKFPVDLLADVSQAEMEHLALNYMDNLLYSNPDSPEHLTLSDSTQVTVNISSVGVVPLYSSSDKKKILALFSPSDPCNAVALYLLDQWWPIEDILKTADPAREGALKVETLGERIVLYALNRIIYRVKEMSSGELPFLCHGENDHAKILWNNGEAVGFYSVKPSGSLCNSLSTRSYQLPVMDSIFVRKCQRGKGFGLQMLEDFVLSFKDDCLGLRYPLTESMYRVCKQYLCQNPEHTNLLWEVESIGGPWQRTNIASKIQPMDLSSVSRSLLFTEESVVNAEVTQRDVVMETIITPIKEAESMEYTVEIMEEVTVVRTTKEAELPVAARGRSSGSKRRVLVEKITQDKSEKVVRIEDIEAETPSEDHVSAQQKTDIHDVSELVQTEGMVTVAPEKDTEDTAPREEAAMESDTATVLASQEVEEPNITSAPMTEEPNVEDDVPQGLTNFSQASQIIVENVASEIEEVVEECQQDKSTVLVVSGEVSNEAEALDKVGVETQSDITDKKSEERVTQYEINISTRETTEGGEAEKMVLLKSITVQSETPKRRSQRHRKPVVETSAHERGRGLRRRTVVSTPTTKHKYTRDSQIANEELDKEDDKVSEESDVSAAAAVEELAITETEEPEESISMKEDVISMEDLREEGEQQMLEDEQLTNEEKTVQHEGCEVADTAVKGSSTENAEDKQEVSEDETEEPPVVQRRSLRGRHKVTPKSTEHRELHQKPEEEHIDETVLGAGSSASEERADEKAIDKQMGVDRVDQEETDDIQGVISTEELTDNEGTNPEKTAEDTIPLTEESQEEGKEFQDKDKETEADTDSVAAGSETAIPDEVLDSALSVAEEPPENYSDSEVPKLQKATVILVDLKACQHLNVKEAGETSVDEELAAQEKEPMELIADEGNDISSYVTEEQTTEPEMLVLEEEDGGQQENIVDAAVEAEAAEKVELEEENSGDGDGEKSETEEGPFIETRVLRSGKKTFKASHRWSGGGEDNTGEVNTEKKVDEAETVTVEMEAEKPPADIEKDIPVMDDAGENLSAAEVDEAMSVEEEEAPVIIRALRSGTNTATATMKQKTTESRKQVDEQEAEEEDNKGQEEEQKGTDESEGVKVTGEDEKAAVDKMDEEREERSEAEIDIEVSKAAAEDGQDEVEEQSKAISNEGEDMELPVTVTRSLRSGGSSKGASKFRSRRGKKQHDKEQEDGSYADEDEPLEEPRILRRGRKPVSRSSSQLQTEEGEPKESVEEEEAGLGLPEVSADKDEGKAPEEDEVVVEKKEPDVVEVEKGVPEEELATTTGEEDNTAGETGTDDLVQGETDAPLPQPTTNSTINTPSEEEATASAEEQQRKQMVPQLSDLPKATVVLVDLNKTHPEVQEESVPEETELEEVVEEEERFGDKVEEAVTAPDEVEVGQLVGEEATASAQKTLSSAEDDKEKDVSEEEKGPGRVLRKGRSAATPRRKSKRVRGQCETEQEKEDEATSAAPTEAKEKEESNNENTEEKNEEESAAKKNEKTEMENVEAVTEESRSEQEEEEQSAVSEEEGQGEASVRERTDEEDAPTVETRVLRSGGKTVRATAQSTEEPVEETRVLRKGKRSVATPGRKSKRARTQYGSEEEGQGTAPAEEMQVSEQSDNSGEEIEKDGEEEKNTEPEAEIEKVKAVAEDPLTKLVEEEQPAVSETVADESEETPVGESAEETPYQEDSNVTEEEEAPVVRARVLRSGAKAMNVTPSSKTTKGLQEEKSSDTDDPTVETRALRKGRRTTPATQRQKSKRARRQYQPEEEGDDTVCSEETDAEKTESRKESSDEKAEEEGTSMEIEVNKDEEQGENVAGVESPGEVAEQLKDASTEKAGGQDNSMEALDVTDIDMVTEGEAKAPEEEQTAATGMRSDTAVTEEEAPVDDACVLTEEEPPAVPTRTLRSKTKTSHGSPSQRSRSHEDQVEENEERQGVTQSSNESPENQDQAEDDETSHETSGQEAGPPAKDTTEDQAKETVDLIDVRVDEPVERAGEEPETKERDSPEEETSESKDSSAVEGRSQIKFPKRRSIQKRPRVDYREDDEEHNGSEAEAATDQEEDKGESDEDKDNKKAEGSADEPQREETKDNDMVDASEKGKVLNLVLDTDEEDEDDEHNTSEEEVEPIVIGRKVLRNRSVPSVIITPQTKSRRSRGKVRKPNESSSDEKRSPQSAQRKSPRKRRSTEVTPSLKLKHHSRV